MTMQAFRAALFAPESSNLYQQQLVQLTQANLSQVAAFKSEMSWQAW